MESAIHWGLAAALKSEITLEQGRVQQQNFSDYEVLRLNDAPERIEVHIVPSNEPPGGCGEPGVPPVAPALCNALFAATGKRIRRLAIRIQELQS
jgi:isoquinoline 1-oxidoreductase beta subunit